VDEEADEQFPSAGEAEALLSKISKAVDDGTALLKNWTPRTRPSIVQKSGS